MKAKTIVIACALSVAAVAGGCSLGVLDDGYQAGDATKALVTGVANVAELRERYCTEDDAAARQLLLLAVRSVEPNYPADGICTDDAKLARILSGDVGAGD